MAKGYMLEEQAMRKTAAMVRRLSGTPRTGQGLQPNSFFGQDRQFVGGKVYGAPLAASTGTKPGKSEFIIDQIELAGPSYVRPDTQNPQIILNTSNRSFAVGDRVRAWLDTAALHADSEQSGHTAVWVTGDDSGTEFLRGACSIGGDASPWSTGSGQNLPLNLSANHDNPPYSLIPHDTLPDTYTGIKIETEGRHLIIANVDILSDSPPNAGTIFMTDGVDLLTKIHNLNGHFRLTVNDPTFTGTPALSGESWNLDAIKGATWQHLVIGDVFWLQQEDEVRLWFQHLTNAACSVGLDYGLWAVYLGDFGTPWTPDS